MCKQIHAMFVVIFVFANNIFFNLIKKNSDIQ